jgi:hypothetical protein
MEVEHSPSHWTPRGKCENYWDLHNAIVEALGEADEDTSLDTLAEMCNHVGKLELEVPSQLKSQLYIKLLKDGVEIPKEGFRCPYPGCNSIFKNDKNLRQHIAMKHKESKHTNPLYTLIARRSENPPAWHPISFDVGILNSSATPCPYPKCMHVSNNGALLKHINAEHPELGKQIERRGWFWGFMIWHHRNEEFLPELKPLTIRKPIACCPQPNCHFFSTDKKEYSRHYLNHKIPLVQNAELPWSGGTIIFNSRETCTKIYEEAKDGASPIEIDNEKKREILEALQWIEPLESPGELEQVEVITNRRETGTTITDNRPFIRVNYRERKKQKLKIQQYYQTSPNEKMKILAKEEKARKLEKAQYWWKTHGKEESDGFRTIMLDVHRRKAVKEGLESLFKHRWIPLVDLMSNEDWSNEELKTIINGIIYKVNHDIRKHVANSLKFNQQLKRHNPGKLSIQKENEIMANKARRRNEEKFISTLYEYYSIMDIPDRGGPLNNRQTMCENLITNFFKTRNEEWVIKLARVFPTSDVT